MHAQLSHMHNVAQGALSTNDPRNLQHALHTIAVQLGRMLDAAQELPGYTDDEILAVWDACEAKQGDTPSIRRNVVATARKLFSGAHVAPRRQPPSTAAVTWAMLEHERVIGHGFSSLPVRYEAMRRALLAAYPV